MFNFAATSGNESYAVSFLRHDTPIQMITGETTTVSVTLRNDSSRTWPARGSEAIRLSYRWFSSNNEVLPGDTYSRREARFFFHLAADNRITLSLDISAPATAGSYILRWDLIEGAETWFSEQGVPTLDVAVGIADPIDVATATETTTLGLRANASHNAVTSGPDNLGNALDGLAFTRWSSRSPQETGMWFALDLGGTRFVRGLAMDIPGSPEHFPRGYAIRVSQDQRRWREVARREQNDEMLNETFGPVATRFIHVSLTQNETQAWWSVHEVRIAYLDTQPEPGQQTISDEALAFITHHEGVRLELYEDAANHCTIGVGHLVHLGPCNGQPSESKFQNGISMAEAQSLLKEDVQSAETAVRQAVKVQLSQNQFDALVSFVFNVGHGNFLSSDLLSRLNQGDYSAVPNELQRWIRAGGQVLPGLVRRREAEGKLFQKGVYR